MFQNHPTMSKYKIGFHTKKEKTIVKTLEKLDASLPYQIFLGNPQGSSVNISEKDLEEGGKFIRERGYTLYIHSPYTINLCYEPGTLNDYPVELLRKNLKYGAAIGAKGVVVHVGKSVKMPIDQALHNMSLNISRICEVATEGCPLLLETPAGQGTELLTNSKDFLEFVLAQEEPNLKICLDTCHVFAAGEDPLEYVKKVPTDLLKLIHFNDSKDSLGCCKDRHEFPGLGKVGLDTLQAIAEHTFNTVDKVVEM